MKGPLSLALAVLLAGCAGPGPAPGSGWSRAPDLSAYSAMMTFASVARDQSALCYGYSLATITGEWDRDFGEREQAVIAALVARHGAEAVRKAEAQATPTQGVECPEVQNWRWQQNYARLLRLLEMRLGLA